MKNRRLNDIEAVQNMRKGPEIQHNTSESTSVRKIDNGFVTTKSGFDGERFHESQEFTPHDPRSGKKVPSDQDGSTLRRANEYLTRAGSNLKNF